MYSMDNDIDHILVSEDALKAKVNELGAQISRDYAGKDLLLVSILKGSVVFMADLMRAVQIPCAIDFMVVSSYGGANTSSTGLVKIIKDLDADLTGRDVLIVEDILDTGITLSKLVPVLKMRNPNSVRICTILSKPSRRMADIEPDYCGFEVPDEFVVGYGLDYDEKYRNNQANYGEYEAKENYMDQIEDFFDEWNLNGYCKEYQKFFTSVEEVIKAPGEASTKNQLINNAASMAQYFNTLSTNLRKIQEDANNEIKDAVEQINSYAQNIASLNRQINQIEANYGDANDLRDKRNALIDDLAQIVNVSINEEDIGNGLTDFRVSINGQTLVAGYDYNKLYTEARADKRNASDAAALYDVKWESGQNFNLYSPSLGGQMKALVDIRDGCNGEFEQYKVDENGDYILDSDGNKVLESVLRNEQNTDFKGIPYYQSQLNQFISTLSESVNNVLKSGLTSDGTQHGISLFVTQTNTDTMTALNITVNPELVKDADKLATRSSAATGQAEADIMEQLRKLQSEKIFDGGTGAYFLESMVSDMSIDSSNATNMLDNYNNLRTTIQNQRLSIMGVDTDEEAMDMMKFQQAYNLNSKMMSVMNEIYDKLINGTGL